jgi:hypothetical protein
MTQKKYDLNRMKKTYPLIRRKPVYAIIDDSQIETALIDISDGEPKTYTFQNEYLTIPVCIATPQDENVNVFITNITLTSVTLNISDNPPEQCFINLQVFKNTSSI